MDGPNRADTQVRPYPLEASIQDGQFGDVSRCEGSHLAYVQTGGGARQVRRVAKDGSGNVVLATGPELSGILYGLNWTDVD